MEYKYRIAKKSDLEILTELRKDVLIAANKLDCNQDMTDVRKKTSEYYKENLGSDNHFAIIATDEGKIIATGAVSFYSVMPTFHNTTGRKAYIMNMYTDPKYRRRGIAEKILKMLLKEIERRNIVEVTLEATDMGKPLYEKCGFTMMKNEMEWTIRKL